MRKSAHKDRHVQTGGPVRRVEFDRDRPVAESSPAGNTAVQRVRRDGDKGKGKSKGKSRGKGGKKGKSSGKKGRGKRQGGRR